tara:strand:- start:367823 stop:369022 length:1200 start_codon:yes stop_codon:yes gene_type:complete
MAVANAPTLIGERQPLTLQQFIGLIKKLSPAKIAQLPLEIIPTNIPADVAEHAPAGSRAAVEDLLMTINSAHLKKRIADVENYGEEIVSAMDKAKNSCTSNTLRVFKNKILTLIELLQASKKEAKVIPEKNLVNQLLSINNLLIDVRSESYSMVSTLDTLCAVKPNSEQDTKRFEALIKRIKTAVTVTENTLGEYYILRLKLLARIIAEKKKNIEAHEESSAEYKKELAILRDELDKTKGFWNRTVKRKSTLAEEEIVQNRIQELINQINQNETVISENDLILWLDTIVDASLNERSQARVAKSLRTARISLYYLLNRFCKGQEESAIQIAQNPFIQVDPEQAIRYMLMSEQFILDYFMKKKNEKTAWLSGAAENKIAELDNLQKEILAELKRATRGIL